MNSYDKSMKQPINSKQKRPVILIALSIIILLWASLKAYLVFVIPSFDAPAFIRMYMIVEAAIWVVSVYGIIIIGKNWGAVLIVVGLPLLYVSLITTTFFINEDTQVITISKSADLYLSRSGTRVSDILIGMILPGIIYVLCLIALTRESSKRWLRD